MGLRGLKAKRMLMGVTQQEISKEIGIACKTYNLKENGVNDFKLSEVSKISKAIKISRKTMKIVKQNIIFAITVKILVLILSAVGIATMWEAVFADVGVSILAIINSLRMLQVKNFK